MGSYFKPLRRKFGIISLVAACLFAMGWVRSIFATDYLIREEGKSLYRVKSLDSLLLYEKYYSPHSSPSSGFDCGSSVAQAFGNPLNGLDIDWRFDMCGFHFGKGSGKWLTYRSGVRVEICAVPYWVIVIPLGFLSAWLLLSKPGICQQHPVSKV